MSFEIGELGGIPIVCFKNDDHSYSIGIYDAGNVSTGTIFGLWESNPILYYKNVDSNSYSLGVHVNETNLTGTTGLFLSAPITFVDNVLSTYTTGSFSDGFLTNGFGVPILISRTNNTISLKVNNLNSADIDANNVFIGYLGGIPVKFFKYKYANGYVLSVKTITNFVPSTLLNSLVVNLENTELNGIRYDDINNNDVYQTGSLYSEIVTSAAGIQTEAISLSKQFNNKLYSLDNDAFSGDNRSFTLAAWVWGSPNADSIAAKHSGSSNEYWLLSSINKYFFRVYTNAGAGFFDAISDTVLSNQWNHIVGWYNKDENKSYISVNDATPVSVNTTGAIVAGDSQFVLAGYHGTNSLLWNGKIGSFRKWDRVLTDTERTTLYNNGYGNIYPFDNPPTSNQIRQFDAFPVLIRLQNGEFKLYYNRGENHSMLNAIVKQKSSLNFLEWEAGDDLEFGDYTAINAAFQNASGTVFRVVSAGLVPTVTNTIYKSNDGGDTWDNGSVITNPLSSWIYQYGQFRQTANGDIYLPIYGENTNETTRSMVFKSINNGLSFSQIGTIGYDATGTNNYNETDMVNVSGTVWYALMRVDAESNNANQNFHYAISTNNCVTWSAPLSIGFKGNAPILQYDDSGNLFLFYRDRENQRFGWKKSTDNGLTFGSFNVIYTDSSPDMGYCWVVFYNGYFYVAYYRTSGLSINIYRRLASTM